MQTCSYCVWSLKIYGYRTISRKHQANLCSPHSASHKSNSILVANFLPFLLPVSFVDPSSPSLWASPLSPIAPWSSPGKASLTCHILIASIHSVVQCGTGDCGVQGMLTSGCPCSCRLSATCSLRWPESKLDLRKSGFSSYILTSHPWTKTSFLESLLSWTASFWHVALFRNKYNCIRKLKLVIWLALPSLDAVLDQRLVGKIQWWVLIFNGMGCLVHRVQRSKPFCVKKVTSLPVYLSMWMWTFSQSLWCYLECIHLSLYAQKSTWHPDQHFISLTWLFGFFTGNSHRQLIVSCIFFPSPLFHFAMECLMWGVKKSCRVKHCGRAALWYAPFP